MDKTSKQSDDWKIIDWRIIAKDFISPSRAWRFIKRRVPQVFAIWAAVAILLRIPPFVSAFDEFGRNIRSPFFTVGRIGSNLPVDITLVFLIGLAAVLVDVLFVAILYVCIKVGRRMAKQRPAKLEEWAGRFANKMTDEMSSILTHCSAATLVLMAGAWPEMRGTQTGLLCATMAAFTFVFGAICYRES
ncbi:hypothetical protein G2912_14050 [Paraburkholderia aspalathi]|uniref:Uncharacterized protein n=1 Tax=Paraburkholderia nemoris TaxID=2793076 RepID=A0ABM8RMR0_9BURK|nr:MULTISPECIES: hypothetical protein [Paraburkholderia]MBK3811476.1 hypothetical protein [Paraburkholderia aspalathi]CAE6761181.1 hypothetical protein R69776_03380 [Paraburkholderia nemoris]